MDEIGIFIVGVIVTLIVGAALTLVIVGAVQDGRLAREAKEDASRQHDSDPATTNVKS